MGRPIDAGLYAFSKEDGKREWSLTKPFAENKNRISNVIFEDDRAWVAGENRIYQFSLQKSTISNELALTDTLDVGRVKEINILDQNQLMVIGVKGFIVLEKSSLLPGYVVHTDDRYAGHYIINLR